MMGRPQLLFTVTAALMIFFGLGFLLIPGRVFLLYGVTLDAGGIMLARVAGSAVLALGTLAWSVRTSTDAQVIRHAATALVCFFLFKTAVTLLAQLSGVFNALGWTILVIDAPLLALYARLRFGRATSAPISARRSRD